MQAETPPAGKRRKASVGFVLAIVAIDAMGIGLVMPVIPDLLKDIAGLSPAEAAPWGGWMAFAYAASLFLFGPLMGDLSDRFGRRPILLIALCGLAFDYIVAAVAPSIWILILARTLSGLAGATYATTTAYLADVSPPEKRAQTFGLVFAAFGIGFVLGPTLGGVLGELGPRAPFYAAAGLCAGMAVLGLVVLPESLPKRKRRRFDWRRSDPFSALKGAAKLPGIAPFLLAVGLFQLGMGVYPAIWSFYTIETLAWSPAQIGLSLALMGVALGVSQGVVIGRLVSRLGEMRTIFLSLTACLISMGIYALTPPEWVVFAALPLIAMAAVAVPAASGLLSSRTREDQQGRLQGVLASLQALTAALAPPLFTFVFHLFSADDAPFQAPGAPFVLGAALTLVAMGVLLASRAPAPIRPVRRIQPRRLPGARPDGRPGGRREKGERKDDSAAA